MKPLNITILNPKTVPWQTMRPVTVTDIFDGITNNLHDEGLYSIPIFGRVGSEERDERFSYIDVGLNIIHPQIFDALCSLKQLYRGIMSGKLFATWDDNVKDFIKSDALVGQTGFSFFLKHWRDIEFPANKSSKRDDKIRVVEKFKGIAMTRRVLILPAGLREVQIDEDGRTIETEVNPLYRRMLSIAKTVVLTQGVDNNPMYDNIRWSLQNSFMEIYNFFENFLKGKRGFLQQKYGRRAVFNATANVITAAPITNRDLRSPAYPDINTTLVGLRQYMKVMFHFFFHKLSQGYLGEVFTKGSLTARLVDRETLRYEHVEVDLPTIDKWTSEEGINKLINGYNDTGVRNKPIIIKGYYLGLIYVDRKYFKIFGDINELPSYLDKKNVRPITYTELFYLAGFDVWNNRFVQNTRYPITGMGSIYPARPFVKTTVNDSIKEMLDEDWQRTGRLATAFPDNALDAQFFDAMAVHPTRLGLAGGDYDGDRMSCNGIQSDEAMRECADSLARRETYISGTGDFYIDVTTDTLDFVMHAMTHISQ